MTFLPHLTKDRLIGAFWTLLSAAIIQVVFTSPINFKILIVLLSVAAMLGILYLRDIYSKPRQFISKLEEQWEHKLSTPQPKATPSIDTIFVTEPDRSQSRVVTEFVAESTAASVLLFFPATAAEKNEVFGRIARVYIGRLLNRSKNIMGVQRRIPISLDAQQVQTPIEGIKRQIAESLNESPDSDAVQSVFAKMEQNEFSVLLLVDAMNKPAHDLKNWFEWQKYKWIPKCIIAAHPDTETEFTSGSEKQFAFLQLTHTGGDGADPQRLNTELTARLATLRVRGGPTMSEYRTGIHALGFAFLRLKLQKPDQPFYSDGEIQSHYQDVLDLIEQLPSWIDTRSSGAIRYAAWKRELQPMRDMLAAIVIIDRDALDDNFCKTVNDSPLCSYVRPMLDYFAEDRNNSEHVLSRYPLTPVHRFIKNAWQPEPDVNDETVGHAREVMKQMPNLFLDPRDIACLLPGFARAGHSAEFAQLFKQVPSAVRVRKIFDSETSGKELAAALESLVDDAELWAFFEGGGVASNISAQLLTLPDQKMLTRCLMIMILAPHGPIIPVEMISHLEHAAKWDAKLWEYSSLPIASSEELDLLARRITDIALQMTDSGRNWIERMNGVNAESGTLTALHERVVAQSNLPTQ